MKPIRLKMTAFGPYKDEEVIDFTELNDHKLFVVSGKTGSGKTTLFDGICFALFGSASGEDRGEVRMMRSHFAKDDVHTSVEFEFDLQGRQYRLLRQLAHVKTGNKSATGEKYEFYEQTKDGEIPCVDRQMVSEINQKVQDLVGLTEDQFKQIVMLPQGEFRKLLTSETDNKEAILRKIFRTEPYQWFTTRMKEKRTEAESELKLAEDRMKQHLSHIQEAIPKRPESRLTAVFNQEHWTAGQVLEGLKQEQEHYQSEAKMLNEAVNERKKAYEKKLGQYHEAKQINQTFEQLAEKETRLETLQKKQPEIDGLKDQLKNAEKAATITIFEQYQQDARSDEERKQQALKQAEESLAQAKKTREQAETHFHLEKEKQPDRDKTKQELDRYMELHPIVENADNQQKKLQAMKSRIDRDSGVLKQNEEEQKQVRTAIENLRKAIRQDEQDTEALSTKKEKLQEMKEVGQFFRSYLEGCKAYTGMKKDLQDKYGAYEAKKQQFDTLEEQWIKGQATVLARHLHDEEPCPVCGSADHPDKALHQGEVPTKESFDQARDAVNAAQETYLNAKAALEAKEQEIKKDKKQLTQFTFTTMSEAKEQFDTYLREGSALKEEVERLTDQDQQLKKRRKEQDDQERQLNTLSEAIQEKQSALQEERLGFTSEQARYETNIARIPENLRTLEALDQAIAELTTKKTQLEKAWEEAEKAFTDAKQTEATSQTTLKGTEEQLAESKKNHQKAVERFTEEVKKAGFPSVEDFKKAVLPEEMRQRLKTEIDTHQSDLQSLTQQVAELNKTLSDKEKVDLEAMDEALKNLQNELEDARQQWTKASDYEKQIENAINNIAKGIEDAKKKEEKFRTIADLHDMIRGQNTSKISFERYIQIEFLEHIIVAANQRLHRISNGQYHLVRSDRQESRGKQSGLSLDVYDAYTGQNRDVKTLSGGEKFNASLSLALGMSDVIQSYQGGVVIDTMFIDEGFGSLDEESLHKVIDTLIDLQKSGRTIGVISHVQEMKTVFPAILEVKKTPEGYSQTRFIVS